MVSGGQTTTVRITLALFLALGVPKSKQTVLNSTCQTWRNCACLCWSLVFAGRDYRRLDWHSFPPYISLWNAPDIGCLALLRLDQPSSRRIHNCIVAQGILWAPANQNKPVRIADIVLHYFLLAKYACRNLNNYFIEKRFHLLHHERSIGRSWRLCRWW